MTVSLRPPRELTESSEIVIDLAHSIGDRARIRREVDGRCWANDLGLHTPEVVAHHPEGAWLASRRVLDAPEAGVDYLHAALAVAERISSADPALLPSVTSHGWRSHSFSRPLRAVVFVFAGIDLGTFVRGRNLARGLPQEVVVHGDFHRANILNSTCEPEQVSIIDWEHLSRGPRYHDAVRLIGTLDTDTLMQAGWEKLVASAPHAHWAAIAVQVRWLALRTFAGEASEVWPNRESAQIVRFRRRYAVAVDWARELERASGAPL